MHTLIQNEEKSKNYVAKGLNYLMSSFPLPLIKPIFILTTRFKTKHLGGGGGLFIFLDDPFAIDVDYSKVMPACIIINCYSYLRIIVTVILHMQIKSIYTSILVVGI